MVSRRHMLQALLASGVAILAPACGRAQQKNVIPAITAQTSMPARIIEESASTGRSTLTYWVELNGNAAQTLSEFGEMTCYKELQRRTGVRPIFRHPPATKAQEQFDQMMALGTYPDVIEWDWLHVPGGPSKALNDGVIIRLNELVDQHAPNLKRVLAAHPEWRRQIMTDAGDLYCFPFLRGHRSLLSYAGPTLRADWLDRLGLEVPTALPAWETVLEAFRTRAPTQGGTVQPLTTWFYRPNGAFDFNLFVGSWGLAVRFYRTDENVRFGAMEPGFRSFLERMRTWFQAGLIDPESFTMNYDQFGAKITGGQLGAAALFLGSGIGQLTSLARAHTPEFRLAPVPFPGLHTGELASLGYADQIFPGTHSAAITSANKNPAETVQWLDYGYSEEGGLLFNFGVEGVSYQLEQGQPHYTGAVLAPKDRSLTASLAQHCRANFGGPFVQDSRYFQQYLSLPEQRMGVAHWSRSPTTGLLPPLIPTADESVRLTRIMTAINVQLDAMITQVCSGAEPLSSWDGFVDKLQELGIDEAITIQQAALTRFNQRP